MYGVCVVEEDLKMTSDEIKFFKEMKKAQATAEK